MADKTAANETTVVDEHGDELIHVPKGQNRLRYLATIALVVFLLVIFVVADLFQGTLTGGGAGPDDVYLTWKDPVSQEEHAIKRSEFQSTSQMLSQMMGFGVYVPPSVMFRDPTAGNPSRRDVEREDVASFLIYDEMANDAGVAVSDEELRLVLTSRGYSSNAAIRNSMRGRMTPAQFTENVRRIQCVQKLQNLIRMAASVSDSNAAMAQWQEDRPEYKFHVATIEAEPFETQASTEVPSDEELQEWFRARPTGEQRALFTQLRIQPEVVYADLGSPDAESEFDSSALLEKYPLPEDSDIDALAQTYYTVNSRTRFPVPPPEEGDPEEGDPEEGDPEEGDPEKGDSEEGEGEAPEDDEDTDESRIPPPFDEASEEAKERARREARINEAMTAFLVDLQDRISAEEEVDLVTEAEGLGLTYELGPEDGMERKDVSDHGTWGSQSLGGSLFFTQEGEFVQRVTTGPEGIVIARATKRFEAEEKPFEEIRDEVVEKWTKTRASELAVEAAETLRLVLAEKPEEVESDNWTPSVELDAFRKLVAEGGYDFYDRPYLGRGEQPDGTARPADNHLRFQQDIWELEPGALVAPRASRDGQHAFLVRYDDKRAKAPEEIRVVEYEGYVQRAQSEKLREFAMSVFRGDGAWFTETTNIAFPADEEAEKRRAAEEDEESEA